MYGMSAMEIAARELEKLIKAADTPSNLFEDLAGEGRTTETVKGNADAIAAHKAETAADDVHNLLSDGKIIEESGSNANGLYIRFANGTQICWNRMDSTRFTSSEMRATWVFPASFAVNPTVTALRASIGTITPLEDEIGQARTSSSTTQAIYSLFRIRGMTDWGASDIFNVAFVAIGRWK